MAILRLKDVGVAQQQSTIRARVCRTWKHKERSSDVDLSSFDAVLVDSEGCAIHATMPARDVSFFMASLDVGRVYEISRFYVKPNRKSSVVIEHPYLLEFRKRTICIKAAAEKTPIIPKHAFHLIEFNMLRSRVDNNSVLVDVLGYLASMQPIETKLCEGSRLEDKRDVYIQNTRREQVRMTLWGDAARLFDQTGIEQLKPPVFIVFTSARVKLFQGVAVLNSSGSTLTFVNPDIPEIALYHKVFDNETSPIEILSLPASAIIAAGDPIGGRRETIHSLLSMDPGANRNRKFTCKAQIIDLNLKHGWYYEACPICTSKLRRDLGALSCQKHQIPVNGPLPWYKLECVVEDDTEDGNFIILGKAAEKFLGVSAMNLVYENKNSDPNVLPPEIKRVLNKQRIFQVYFGKANTSTGKSDIVVSNVLADDLTDIVAEPVKALEKSKVLALEGSPSKLFASTSHAIDPLTPSASQPVIAQTPATDFSVIDSGLASDEPTTAVKRRLLFSNDDKDEGGSSQSTDISSHNVSQTLETTTQLPSSGPQQPQPLPLPLPLPLPPSKQTPKKAKIGSPAQGLRSTMKKEKED